MVTDIGFVWNELERNTIVMKVIRNGAPVATDIKSFLCPEQLLGTKVHVIEISDLVDLWVIKVKSLWSFARVVRWDHVNR